jgi:hypothetical protein
MAKIDPAKFSASALIRPPSLPGRGKSQSLKQGQLYLFGALVIEKMTH